MQKEDWINEIMQSSADIQQAEPNPYLFNKIKLNIEQPQEKEYPVFTFKWAFTFVAIVGLNIACISFVSMSNRAEPVQTTVNTVYSEMNLNTIYNY